MKQSKYKQKSPLPETFDFSDLIPEEEYDNITRLAAAICEVPISLITVLGKETQYFKSNFGLDVDKTPLEHSFCAYAIKDKKQVYVVEDARINPIFKNNPYVKAENGVVFYAGVPLSRKQHHLPVGTLCVIDNKPRELSERQIRALITLGTQVEKLLELRASKAALEKEKAMVADKSERLENIIRSTEVGTWEWSMKTGEVTINKRYAEMIGYTHKELTPFTLDTWHEILHPDDHKLSDNALKDCFDNIAEFYDIECRLVHKKGHIVWINDRGKVVKRDNEGKALLMTGTHTDITERKNTEALFKTISDNVPGVVFRYQRIEGSLDMLQYVSKGAVQVWGYEAEEVIKDNLIVWNSIFKEDIAGLLTSIETSATSLKPWTFQWRYNHPDGTVKWHKGTGNPTRNSETTIYWDCVIMDITIQKNNESELLETTFSLNERIKEQKCLYAITQLTQKAQSVEELLKQAVKIIPQGFKYPELAKAEIRYGDVIFKTPGFKSSKHILQHHEKTANDKPLSLTVCYPNSITKTNKNPFIKVETELLKSITNSILLHINHFETENQKELILNSTIEGIYGINTEGKCSFINPSGAKMLGYSQEECLGINIHELIHYQKEDGSPLPEKDCPIYKAKVTKKGCKVEDDIFWRKDGSLLAVRYTSTPIIVDKKITGAVVIFSDITEKKQKDLLLQTNEKRFKALVQEGSDLISILDRDGIYTYISPTSHRIIGFSQEYLLGKNVKEFIHPDDWQELNDHFALLKDQKQVTTKPFRYKNSRNEWRWLETTATNLLKDPAIEGIVTNSRDVTERLLFEEELQESNERHELVNKATNDAIYDWDIENDLFKWGDAFQKKFGHDYSSKPFKLSDWIALTHPLDEVKHEERWLAFLNDPKQNRWINEFRFLKADGQFAYVEEIGFLLRNAKGKPLRMIGVLRDKTDIKIREIQKEIQNEISVLFKNEKLELKQIISKTLGFLADYSGFKFAELWLVSNQNKHLNLIDVYKKNGAAKTFFKLSKEVNQLKKGEGLPGQIWKNNSFEIWDNIDRHKKYLRKEAAKVSGLKSAIGLPLTHNQNVVGVLILSSLKSAKENEEHAAFYKPLSEYLGAEIKRKQQEEEIQLFFNNAPDIMAIAGPDGYFTKVNPAFCKLLGYTQEELTTTPFKNFFHPEDLNTKQKEYSETITGKRLANHFVNRYRTKKGDYRWISWNSSEVYGEDKQAYAYGRDITERIELQQLFENAAKMAKIGSWELDFTKETANNLFWSGMTKTMFEVEDDYNASLSGGMEFFVGEHKRTMSQAVQNLIKTGESFDLELMILSGQGNLKWVRCIGQSDRMDGKCVKIYGSYQDIDQRKSAEVKVKDALLERDSILESIGDAFFAVDHDWYVTYWNKKAEQLLLTKKDEILGKNLWAVFKAHVGLKSYNEYHWAMMNNEIVHFEDYYPENNSWLEVSAYPSKTGLSVYFKDITERKLQEKQIRDTNERFEKITEATNDAIWDFDVINNIIFWGKGYENQFGYQLDEITPTVDFVISSIHPDDREHIAGKIQKFMTDGASTNWFEEYRFKRADGSYAYVVDRAIFIRDEESNVTRVVGAMTDISYRREYEESLKQLNEKLKRHSKELEISNQELEQFAYVTSHDLQEPLRMISSFLMLLEKKYGDKLDEKAHEYIYYAVDGAKRMKKIILDLLEFSKVGRFEDERETIDVNKMLEEYCILRKKLIQENNVSIVFNKLPNIATYRAPLTQIFHNLLDNAIKYRKEDTPPEIQITATENHDHWEFAVKDNGIGISPDFFGKIFIIFQRLHNKDIYDGTGMGLAIVKKIIETLEGKIWVSSQPGEGSTFYFTIPKTG
jgi:PAS domain S-box-containing protein